MSIKVSAWVWKHSNHRGTTKLVLLALAEHANDSGICWPTVGRLSEYVGESERHIRRIIKELVEAGDLLVSRGGGRGNTTRYGIAVGLSPQQRQKLNSVLENSVLQNSVSENSDLSETVTSGGINSDIWGTKTVTSGAADDVPNNAPECTEPAQTDGGIHHRTVMNRQKGASRADRTPPETAEKSDHQALMDAYAGWLGYPIPNGGKEAAAARKLLTHGYTLEQIDRAYHDIKTQPFYGEKHVSLQVVYEQIGALLNKPKPKRPAYTNGVNGSHPTGPPPVDYDSIPSPYANRPKRETKPPKP